jgi:hypothetical protein
MFCFLQKLTQPFRATFDHYDAALSQLFAAVQEGLEQKSQHKSLPQK